MKYLILFLISFPLFAARQNVIHGNDDRYEWDSYVDKSVQDLGKSVGLIVNRHRLYLDPETDTYKYGGPTLKRKMRLCPEVRFSEQKVIGRCTGFLVAPNLLLTAGHCFDQSDLEASCLHTSVVFDYFKSGQDFEKETVFRCKKIIKAHVSESKNYVMDYALIELDRDTNRDPLVLTKREDRVPLYTPLVMIGYPLGLPQKIADGAVVKGFNEKEWKNPLQSTIKRKYYFHTNLDAFSGNSGSPIFNEETKEVEGILIQGDDFDFIMNEERWCQEDHRKPNSGLVSEEMALRVNEINSIHGLIAKYGSTQQTHEQSKSE
jgi:V8-like Glu-specific endopeptidase